MEVELRLHGLEIRGAPRLLCRPDRRMRHVNELPRAMAAPAHTAPVQMPGRLEYASYANATTPWGAGQLEKLTNIYTVRAERDADPAANQFLGFILGHDKLLFDMHERSLALLKKVNNN
ncbi:hypothetical protein [Burkholderia ubonensis]|nr:hypothetical protein [Burkholderia ubonensis]